MTKVIRLVGVMLAVSASIGVAACSRATAPVSGRKSLALVLEGKRKSTVHVVDLERGTVVGSVRLRSFCSAIAADRETKTVVTAQAGGIANDADDVVGLIDLTRQLRVRYVKLAMRNPDDVAVADGWACVVHGVETARGMVATPVEVATGRVGRTGTLPATIAALQRVGGRTMSSIEVPGSSKLRALVSVEPRTMAVSRIATVALESFRIAGEAGNEVVVVGWQTHSGLRGLACEVWRIDARDGSVRSRQPLRGLGAGADDAVAIGDRLAVLDADSAEALGSPAAVVIYDLRSARRLATLRLRGTPVAISACGDQLLVADGVAGRLSIVDPKTARTIRTVRLGLREPVSLRIEPLD